MYKLLSTNRFTKAKYIGVDVNKLEKPEKFQNRSTECTLYGERDLCSLTPEETEGVNVVSSFEVLEHVPPGYARKAVQFIYDLLPDHGIFVCSTPNWDPHVGAAKNHMNEMKREALGWMFEDIGFTVEKNFGTFASQKDYKPHMSEAEIDLMKRLSEYYDTNVMATIFAPLYPEYSRNNLWVLIKKPVQENKRFELPAEPWSQHPDYRDLKGNGN